MKSGETEQERGRNKGLRKIKGKKLTQNGKLRSERLSQINEA